MEIHENVCIKLVKSVFKNRKKKTTHEMETFSANCAQMENKCNFFYANRIKMWQKSAHDDELI